MCRPKAEGGRRCPCDDGEIRRARQRASYAIRRVTGPVAVLERSTVSDVELGIADADNDDHARLAELNRQLGQWGPHWKPEISLSDDVPREIRDLSREAFEVERRIFDRYAQDGQVPDLTDWSTEQLRERAAELRERLDAGTLGLNRVGDAELGLTMFGAGLSERAHRLAGTTPVEVRDGWVQRNEEALADFERTKADFERAKATTISAEETVGIVLAFDTARVRLAAVRNGTDVETVADMDRLAHAYRDVLAELRPLGGTVHAANESDRRSLGVLNEAMAVYPADWIKASNAHAETQPLRVKATKGRAHYSGNRQQIMRHKVPKGVSWTKPADWTPPDGDPAYLGWERLDGRGFAHWPEREGESVWRAPEWERSGTVEILDPDDGVWRYPPRGRGWEKHRWTEYNGRTFEAWQRAKMTTEDEYGPVTAELLVGERGAPGGCCGTRKGSSVAAHEFAHRCEHVNPRIKQAEQAFLSRRTRNSDGSRQDVEAYAPHLKDEVVRPDGFANRYIGKDYGHGREDTLGLFGDSGPPSAEVLSCGVEAIFAHQHGGLIGISAHAPERGGNRADHDTRNFVLGVMAAL